MAPCRCEYTEDVVPFFTEDDNLLGFWEENLQEEEEDWSASAHQPFVLVFCAYCLLRHNSVEHSSTDTDCQVSQIYIIIHRNSGVQQK